MTPESLANVAFALSEPVRLRLLRIVALGIPMNVTQLSESVVPAIRLGVCSKHMKILSDARLVIRRDSGRGVFFYLNDKVLAETVSDLTDFLKLKGPNRETI